MNRLLLICLVSSKESVRFYYVLDILPPRSLKKSWRARRIMAKKWSMGRSVGSRRVVAPRLQLRGVRGDFRVGDAVRVLGEGGVEIGRGLARVSVAEAALTAGRAPEGDDADGTVVIHRDDLVAL